MKESVASSLLQWLLGMAYRVQSMIPTEYEQVGDGDVIDVNWRERDSISLSCCDCGLVHYVRVFAAGNMVRLRLWRDEESTEAQREERGIIYDAE